MRTISSFATLGFCLVLPFATAQKKPLDHSVYDSWNSIRGTSLSHDGKWILYVVAPQEGDGEVQIKSLVVGKTISFPRGGNVQFSNDSNFVVATIVPKLADTKKATRDKVPAADMPKNSLMIQNLSNEGVTVIERVTSFQLPAEDSGWLTYRPEAPRLEAPATGNAASGGTAGPQRPAAPGGRRGGGGGGGARQAASNSTAPNGSPLVIRNLPTGKEERIENVGEALFSKDGKVLAYTVTSREGKEDGVYWLDLPTHSRHEILKGKAKYLKIALSDETKALAVLTDKKTSADEPAPTKPLASAEGTKPLASNEAQRIVPLSLFLYEPKSDKTRLIAGASTREFPRKWTLSENGNVSFSNNGTRLYFGTAPKPDEEKKDDTPDSEKVSLDVWTWKDKKIMPQALLQASADQKKTYLAVAFLDSGKIVQLETEAVPSVSVSNRGDGEFALGSSDDDYRLQSSWDDGYTDFSIVDVKTGAVRSLLHRSEAHPSFSPDGKFLSIFDSGTKQYAFFDSATLKRTESHIPVVLYNELTDTPSTPPALGEAGWTKDDGRLLVYGDSDIWAIDPTGRSVATNMTGNAGRMSHLRFRYVSKDPEERYIDLSRPLLLSAFDTNTKEAGFYTENAAESHPNPSRLIFNRKVFSTPLFAKNGAVLSFSQQDFIEFPDVWVANPDFTNARKLSNANPQQSQYNWGNAELVNWVSGDGQQLQGILIKPENFTYGKKYPMVTYFYERLSDSLNAYHAPAPSASTINFSYFASNGYLVFIPDIPYKTGYPGESATSAIISGVLSIVNRGYVDSARLGIQGHSWGGYQVAYLVTHTNLFKCAMAGAAVVDMFSAYGGIRYGTGILREGQYEHGQSRIGASPWDKPLRYFENSPLFFLDKVETPILLMQNDKDGAVPFTQGIEFFSGLRRLGKPAWMCVYNGEDHNLVERKNRKDWSIRLSQFFDHYLMDKPMPVWMSKGIPATQKGKTSGFDLDPDGQN